MARQRSSRPPAPAADLDGARTVLRELADARAAEVRARKARDLYIANEHARGVRAIDTAETLQTVADELRLDAAERRKFGVSEGSVHHALTRLGAKEAR